MFITFNFSMIIDCPDFLEKEWANIFFNYKEYIVIIIIKTLYIYIYIYID